MQAVPEYKGVVAHRPGIDVGVNAGRDLTLYRRFRIAPPPLYVCPRLRIPVPLTPGEAKSGAQPGVCPQQL